MKYILLLVVAFILMSCSSVGKLRTNDVSFKAQSRPYKEVKVFAQKDIGQAYDIVGVVVANSDAGENARTSVKDLRKQAAKLGADAIVDLRLSYSYGYWNIAIESTGLAVIYK